MVQWCWVNLYKNEQWAYMAERRLLKEHFYESVREQENGFVSNEWLQMTKMATTPIYGKNPLENFLSSKRVYFEHVL